MLNKYRESKTEENRTGMVTISPTLEAHCLELCTLMMKSMLELPKLVQHLAGYVEVFGTEAESDLTHKLKVYRSVVLPTLLYACETWTVYQRHAKRLNHFHTSCLRKFLRIKWQDRIQDTEVLKRAGMQSKHTFLKLAQLRCTGHVIRMPDERLPKKILYGELQVGKRSHGGQKRRYKDTLKASLKDFNIPTESWVMGTDCTRSYKVARPHKKGSW